MYKKIATNPQQFEYSPIRIQPQLFKFGNFSKRKSLSEMVDERNYFG